MVVIRRITAVSKCLPTHATEGKTGIMQWRNYKVSWLVTELISPIKRSRWPLWVPSCDIQEILLSRPVPA